MNDVSIHEIRAFHIRYELEIIEKYINSNSDRFKYLLPYRHALLKRLLKEQLKTFDKS